MKIVNEKRRYQNRVPVDIWTLSKQDQRSFRRQEGDEDDKIKQYYPALAKSTLGLIIFTIAKSNVDHNNCWLNYFWLFIFSSG